MVSGAAGALRRLATNVTIETSETVRMATRNTRTYLRLGFAKAAFAERLAAWAATFEDVRLPGH